MGFLSIRSGDLFFSSTPALGHGVNIRGIMNARVAKEFRLRFPGMYREYRDMCAQGRLAAGSVHAWQDPRSGRWVYNLASQDEPGAYARLEWLDSSARAMVEHASRHRVSKVALPRIGCGIGGLRWVDAERVLSGVARDASAVQLEVWTG